MTQASSSAAASYTTSDNISLTAYAMTTGSGVTYSATGLEDLTFSSMTGMLSGSPTVAYSPYSIYIVAEDNSCQPGCTGISIVDDTVSFTVTAAGGGDPTWTSNVPMMNTSLTPIIDASVNISLSVTTNPPGNSVTYTASSLPPGLSLSGSSIIGTPRTAGTYTVNLTATDDVNSNYVTTPVTFNVDPVDSTVVYYVDETPAAGILKALGFSAGENIDYTFRANRYSSAMNISYTFLANLGDVPGETLSVDEFPQWLNWNTYAIASDRYAKITGTTPSQDIAYDYNFTVRAYDTMNFDLAIQDPATFNDRDYELNVLADATCVSPVNNICT